MSNIENTGRRGPMAEAAERFDRIARVVKDQQLSETRTGPRVALTDSLVASPEEAWAKKFMTQAIGPAATGPITGVAPALAPQSAVPHASQGFSATAAGTAVARTDVSMALPGSRAIGEGIGRSARKRTWLGWLLLGR